MLFVKVLIALSAAASATAYAVPSGAADGTYVAFMVDGKEVHLTVEDFEKKYPELAPSNVTDSTSVLARTQPAPEGNELMSRQVGVQRFTYCGCGYNMVDWETDRAVQGLKDQFSNGEHLRPRLAVYTIRGPVVAFLCSRSSLKILFTPDSIGNGFAYITNRCGRYIAGSREYPHSIYGYTILGYMRYNGNGHDFCRESTGSRAETC